MNVLYFVSQQTGPMHFTASSEPKEIADEENDTEMQKMEPKIFDEVS